MVVALMSLFSILGIPTARDIVPPQVDRIWLWVYYNKIPYAAISYLFYLLKGTIAKGIFGI